MKPKYLRLAFTIIELMVTLAIIALLATLSLQALRGTKNKAEGAVCSENLRQQGHMLSLFVNENNEYPLFINHDVTKYPAHESIWLRSLGGVAGLGPKEIGEASTFFCPRARIPRKRPNHAGYIDYGYNLSGILGAPGQQGLGLGAKAANDPHTDAIPVKPEDIVSPSLMIAIGDSIHANAFGLLSDGDASIGILYWVSERIAGSHGRSLRRHQANANYLFCDGHVATLPIQPLLQSDHSSPQGLA